jgi:predicted metalloprotease
MPVPNKINFGLSDIQAIGTEIDTYWRSQPMPDGYTYRSPQIDRDTNRPASDIPCLDNGSNPGPAFYCPANETIYFTYGIESVAQTYGYDAVYATVAHEWTHHIQHILGERPPTGAQADYFENQADCGAGAYMANTGLFDSATWQTAGYATPRGQDLLHFFASIGSPTSGGTVADPHGTPAERDSSFTRGLTSGSPAGCGLPLAPAVPSAMQTGA